MAHTSEYEIEDIFIDRLEGIGYKFIKLNNYDEVLANFREQLAKFNAKKLEEKGHTASFSDSEFNRIMIHVDNHSVYESAKVLRDKYDLQLDNGESVYIEFFSGDTDRNIYQVTHQVTMDKAHKDDVVYKNRYDVTVLINGLPLVQIELKRPGVEINEAINQINRYRKFSFKGIFRYLQLFVVSNSVQTKYFCNENEMLDGQYNPILKSLVFFWTDEKNTRINDLNTFTGEFFRKSAITEMLNKYMVIKTTEPVLMVMRPYQIYAVKAAKKRVLELGFDKCSTKMVKPNTVVMALAGQGKTRGMVAITRVPLCTNQSLCAIETNDDICDDYLYQYLQTQYNNLRLISSGDGTRGGLNLKLVGGYVVSMPCFIEQQKIVACLSALDDVIEKKKATLAAWEELKKGLLQQMFV